jgi:hypothetical protein
MSRENKGLQKIVAPFSGKHSFHFFSIYGIIVAGYEFWKRKLSP